MKSKTPVFAACLALLVIGVVIAEERPEPKPQPAKKAPIKAIAAPVPVRMFGDLLGAGPRVEFNENGAVIKGKVDKAEIEISSTKDKSVRLTVVRSYSVQDPELQKKYPHLHKHLNNLAIPMVEEKVSLKVEARKVYEAKSTDELTKNHPELTKKYAQYVDMFQQMARFNVRGVFGGKGIRINVRPAVPIKRRPAPAPRKVEPKPERK